MVLSKNIKAFLARGHVTRVDFVDRVFSGRVGQLKLCCADHSATRAVPRKETLFSGLWRLPAALREEFPGRGKGLSPFTVFWTGGWRTAGCWTICIESDSEAVPDLPLPKEFVRLISGPNFEYPPQLLRGTSDGSGPCSEYPVRFFKDKSTNREKHCRRNCS